MAQVVGNALIVASFVELVQKMTSREEDEEERRRRRRRADGVGGELIDPQDAVFVVGVKRRKKKKKKKKKKKSDGSCSLYEQTVTFANGGLGLGVGLSDGPNNGGVVESRNDDANW